MGKANPIHQTKDNNIELPKGKSDDIRTELDRRAFYLKTLYDISLEICGTIEVESVLKNFLLMTMGSFGVVQGFLYGLHLPTNEIYFVSKGLHGIESDRLKKVTREFLLEENLEGSQENSASFISPVFLPEDLVCTLSFRVGSDCAGLVALGAKLTGEAYNEDDKELLRTLVNNLVVALKNARAFQDIRQLNQDLQGKNIQLKKTLEELQAAIRKIEILEGIKANLSSFVPNTVTRLIEKSPTASLPESKEQDVSVLFIDIQGYGLLSERLEGAELHSIVEQYFSVFMDAIHANNGDVNETAGDGLMVIYLNEDMETNALDAIRTALTIREKVRHINRKGNHLSEPLVVNMGISSGNAFVGIAKFESLTGCRCTYTARGMVTNLAARLGAFASEGAILLSKSTADRVESHFSLTPLGKFELKNVSEEVDIFSV